MTHDGPQSLGAGVRRLRISRVYVDYPLSIGQTIPLNHRIHHHLIHVLRLHPGQPLIIFNGLGGEYEGTLKRLDNTTSGVVINRRLECHRESKFRTTLLQGISRSDHMSFALQKTVELGVHEIYPVVTHRSPLKLGANRIEKKLRHWKQIVIASCEQCGRTRIPKLYSPITLSKYFLDTPHIFGIILDPSSSNGLSSLPDALGDIAILIGAEGGLTDEEIALASDNGFQTVRLGPRVLRTETAAMAILAAIQALRGDFG